MVVRFKQTCSTLHGMIHSMHSSAKAAAGCRSAVSSQYEHYTVQPPRSVSVLGSREWYRILRLWNPAYSNSGNMRSNIGSCTEMYTHVSITPHVPPLHRCG
jgi:hypothetical protein